MIVGLFSGETFIRLTSQKLRDQVLCLGRDILPHWVGETELTAKDVVNDFFVLFASEGWLTREHDEQDDAH